GCNAKNCGALYVHLGDLQQVNAIFYGVSPAVIALILHSCYRLAPIAASLPCLLFFLKAGSLRIGRSRSLRASSPLSAISPPPQARAPFDRQAPPDRRTRAGPDAKINNDLADSALRRCNGN